MSLSFYVENKKGFMSTKAMKVGQIFDLYDGLSQFSFHEYDDDFDLNEFYSKRLNEYECILLGVDGRSSRGFEISYHKFENGDFYGVRLLTPSSIQDWKIALSFIKKLSTHLKSDIVTEHGEVYSADNIEEFPFKEDILYGIKALLEHGDGKDSNTIMLGINRKVYFNLEMSNKILNAPDPVQAFSEIFESIQNLDAYTARQRFYTIPDDDKLIGMYVLTETVDTILPYKPSIEFENTGSLSDDQIGQWLLSLIVIDGDPNSQDSYHVLDDMDYKLFIERLSKEKYRFIDAASILVEGLSRAEMEKLLQ